MSELGGVVATYLSCEGEKDEQLENLIDRWKAWESSLLWNGLIPELPFNEDERNYLNSELLDSFSIVMSEGFRYYLTDNFFHCACIEGQLVLVQWLYDRFPQYILQTINYLETFRWICTLGRFQVVEWFLETFPEITRGLEERDIYRHVLYGACAHGKLTIARLLVEKHPKLIKYKQWSLALAEVYGHKEIIDWLNSLKG